MGVCRWGGFGRGLRGRRRLGEGLSVSTLTRKGEREGVNTLALYHLAEAQAPVNGAANEDGVEAAQVFAALQAVEGGTVQMLGEHVAQANHYALWRHLPTRSSGKR